MEKQIEKMKFYESKDLMKTQPIEWDKLFAN